MCKLLLSFSVLFWSVGAYAHGISEGAKQALIEGGYFKYFVLGAEHMLTGYDHLLFLFGVIFFLKGFKDIVKFISAFTIGHSLTLIFATFMGITANYWLIDAVIALTVCYKGFDNNKGFQEYFGMTSAPNLLLMVFVFGLMHGFGLSTRLQQLPLGEEFGPTLMRIISFNLGVELGQIFALSIMLVCLNWLRKLSAFNRLSRVLNHGLILAGFLLFLMQMHGYLHTSKPDEFGFGKESHIYEHIQLDQQRHNEHHHEH